MTGIIAGLLSDCLSFKGVPSDTLGGLLGRVIQKRHDTLREIILCEMRQGNFNEIDQDELISVFFRLIRDAEEGIAKNNLRLLARVINGMAEKKKLKASIFFKYAGILASLTEEEIIVLAIMSNLNWATFMPQKAEEEFKKHGINNHVVIQQALLRTGLVTMEIEVELPNEREMKALGVGNRPPTTHQQYTLTPLFSEIEKYIETFEVFERAA